MEKEYRRNEILTVFIGLAVFFGGFIMSFFLLEAYSAPLGSSDPLYLRFLSYFGDFWSGFWGNSVSVSPGTPVSEILIRSVPHTIELLIFPLCIGIILGYYFGRKLPMRKHKCLKWEIQFLSTVVIACPIFIFCLFLQTSFYLVPIFPCFGYKAYRSPEPPLITGFLILDSLISGNTYLALDILYHYAIPTIILTVSITALMIKLFSSQVMKDSYKKQTLLSHTTKTIVVIGAILTYLCVIDVIFGLDGIGSYFISALQNADFFLIRGFLFIFIILFTITIFISNVYFSLNKEVKQTKLPIESLEELKEEEPILSPKIELKDFFKKIIRSPLTIIGLCGFLILLHAVIFPELISGYTFEQTLGVYTGGWRLPSPEHFLGTAMFGRDVLALVVYGTRDALIFGFSACLIGLIGSLVFGLIISKFYRKTYKITMFLMIIFYIFPGILLFFFLANVIEHPWKHLMFITGLLLVPSFTRIISNTEFRIAPITKKIISYVPLFTGFAILFYTTVGFLGFSDLPTVNLGYLINEARFNLNSEFALLAPSGLLFFIVMSLFMLHEDLVKHSK